MRFSPFWILVLVAGRDGPVGENAFHPLFRRMMVGVSDGGIAEKIFGELRDDFDGVQRSMLADPRSAEEGMEGTATVLRRILRREGAPFIHALTTLAMDVAAIEGGPTIHQQTAVAAIALVLGSDQTYHRAFEVFAAVEEKSRRQEPLNAPSVRSSGEATILVRSLRVPSTSPPAEPSRPAIGARNAHVYTLPHNAVTRVEPYAGDAPCLFLGCGLSATKIAHTTNAVGSDGPVGTAIEVPYCDRHLDAVMQGHVREVGQADARSRQPDYDGGVLLKVVGAAVAFAALILLYAPNSVVEWLLVQAALIVTIGLLPRSRVAAIASGAWLIYFWVPVVIWLLRQAGILG